MAFIKCTDCGKIYDVSLVACPQCGCPTEQQQLPPRFNGDDTTPIDIKDIIDIVEDKFEETKVIGIITSEILSSSIDEVCQSVKAKSPQVHVVYHVEKGVGQLLVCYEEHDFLKRIESIQDQDLADKYGWPCRQMVINIDDKENIRLDLENNKSIWNADFPISQEMFLKCCNAKKLEFKITKENGESIIVNGYYGFDPETGAEVDEYGNVLPENELILNFQTLYNYAIDPTMFKDALRRRKMLDEWILIQLKSLVQKKEKEWKEIEAKVDVAQDNDNHGVLWMIFGILLSVVGVCILIECITDMKPFLALPGVILFVVGIPIIAYGILRAKGYNSTQAKDKINEYVSKMNH